MAAERVFIFGAQVFYPAGRNALQISLSLIDDNLEGLNCHSER